MSTWTFYQCLSYFDNFKLSSLFRWWVWPLACLSRWVIQGLRRSWGGILVWACPSVCPSVTLFGSWETQEPLMIESWNFIYGIHMKNKRIRIFFSLRQSCHSGVMPLFRLCMNNLVSRISEKPLRLGSRYLAYSYRSRCRWTDELLNLFRKFLVELFPFLEHRHFV